MSTRVATIKGDTAWRGTDVQLAPYGNALGGEEFFDMGDGVFAEVEHACGEDCVRFAGE